MEVKAIGNAKTWSDVFSYSFIIRPPWWQTWWAYGLYCLVVIAISLALRRYELNRYPIKAEVLRLHELDTVKTKLYKPYSFPLTLDTPL